MDVVIYMVLTEAVKSLASGTVAELQIGIVGVSSAANFALVTVRLTTLCAGRLLFCSFFEIYYR